MISLLCTLFLSPLTYTPHSFQPDLPGSLDMTRNLNYLSISLSERKVSGRRRWAGGPPERPQAASLAAMAQFDFGVQGGAELPRGTCLREEDSTI